MNESDDAQLLAGCVEGRKDCWDVFVGRFSKLVYWSIYKTFERSPLRQRQDIVDDVFQEVFTKLVEKAELERLRKITGLRKFLSVIAAHTAMDTLRRLEMTEKRHVSLETADEDPFPGSMAGAHEDLLGQVLSELNSRERACLELHLLDGKTHREVSLILGLPQDTVSTIVRRTKEKLKKKFLEKGWET